jgi:hypothetical protein
VRGHSRPPYPCDLASLPGSHSGGGRCGSSGDGDREDGLLLLAPLSNGRRAIVPSSPSISGSSDADGDDGLLTSGVS